LTIAAADVDHDVEVLEIVDGVMQAPTGPDMVSWYKETGRLGEPTNMIIAGHLNWWGILEGVFYHLDELEDGDQIEITGNDGATYVYEVQWVRQESNLAPPELEVVGPTDEPSLTLITCGGEWNSSISEYDERTVVQAVQIEIITADEQEAAMMLAA
jgi:sortase (surface protein transpeptidase)